MTPFDQHVADTQRWFDSPRFARITRLYGARRVVAQRGSIATDYTVAREAAAAFYERLRELFAERKSITTFGPFQTASSALKLRPRTGCTPSTSKKFAVTGTPLRRSGSPAPLSRLSPTP